MPVFVEGDLQITINNAEDVRKFDGPGHGMSHCMKAVDFIVELADRYLYIEFKDPQHPRVPDAELQEFIRDLQSGRLDEDFKYKFRDSFLYEWASGRADKPVYYLMLIALDSLTDTDLDNRSEDLRRKLPVAGPSSWVRQIVEGCAVFNIDSWNRNFPDYPVARRAALG